MKTQVIATLTNYAHEVLGKKVLLVCPTSKARDELVKRCKNVFGLEVSDCDKKFYPNAYLKHSSKCNRKRSMTDGEVTKVFEGEQCKVTKRRRKMSMENLKSIAKDEIKGFKSFNLLRYLNK